MTVTALLAECEASSWPEAVTIVAGMALVGFVIWVWAR